MPNDRSWAHDPLALLALAEPEWFTLTRMAVAVEADGRVRGTPDEASPVEVVTDLDPEGAHTAFLRSLGCAPAGPPRGLA
jgi:inosine-uridine nucleoside N-ribohydrolase